MKLPTLFLSTVILASTFAVAAEDAPVTKPDRPKGTVETRFKKLDVNVDGLLSLEEFMRSRVGKTDPAKAEQVFKSHDKDANGSLTFEELKANVQAKKPSAEAAPKTLAPVEGKKPASTVAPEEKATP